MTKIRGDLEAPPEELRSAPAPSKVISRALARTLGAVWLGGCVVLSGAVARAEAPAPGVVPVHVIAIQSDDADDQADALTTAIRSRVRAVRGFSLVESDFALEVLALSLKCGETPDESCQAKIADNIHADRYIWGTLRRSKAQRQVIADLRFWSRGQPSIRTQLTFSDNLTAPGDEALKRLTEEALGKLLDPQKTASAASPSSSARPPLLVPVDDPAKSTKGDVARPGGSRSGAASSADVSEEASSSGHRTAGWAGVGLGGVLLGAGVYSVLRVHAIDNDRRVELYRQGFSSGADVCDEASAGVDVTVDGAATAGEMRDFCSAATTFQTLQYIFLGLGAVSAGAGIYLLATDKGAGPAGAARLRLSPSIARSAGRLDMTLSF